MPLHRVLRTADPSPVSHRAEGLLDVYPNWDDPLLPLMAAYHAAVIRSDGLQSKLREAHGDEELLDRSLVAAEQVIEARAALYRGLIELGWKPPPMVVDNLAIDLEVLHLPGGV